MSVQPRTDAFADSFGVVAEALDRWAAGDIDHLDAHDPRATWRAVLDRSLPEDGVGAEATLAEFVDHVVPYSIPLSTPGFWGWITSGPSTVPTAITAGTMVAGPQRQMASLFNFLEDRSLEWLRDLCGLSPHLKGVYSSGGSTANLIALGAARQWAMEQRGVDVARDGLAGHRLAIYCSEHAHHTIHRSAGVLGIGRAQVRMLPVDAHMRVELSALREALARDVAEGVVPVAVVGLAGSTDTGAIDPLRAMGEVAAEYGAWFHVDGAYGLPGILDDRISDRFDGLDLADSAIVDPHKWLAAPVGVGATYVRDRELLARAFTQEPAAYLSGTMSEGEPQHSLDSLGTPFMDYGVELSAMPRGVTVWALLRELGRAGVTNRVRTDRDFARKVADFAEAHPRLELLLEPELSVVCLRYRPVDHAPGEALDALNQRLLSELNRSTRFVVSSTELPAGFAIRPCFINVRTVEADIDEFLGELVAAGDRLASTAG